jgi:uncharacterized membrane protein HdeD (DUF308 family)
MKKNIFIYAYGAIIVGEGVLLIYSKDRTLETLTTFLGLGLITGSILAFFAAFSRQTKQVQFAYHESHAITMLAYGFYVLFFCRTLEMLTNVTAFVLMFYAFKEIIFCSLLFNLGQKVAHKVLIIRLLLGLITGIGTIMSLFYQQVHMEWALMYFGVLFVLIGINIMMYVPLIPKEQTTSV